MNSIRIIVALFVAFFSFSKIQGQNITHSIAWSGNVKKVGNDLFDIQLIVNPTDGWMTISPFQDKSGIAVATKISLKSNIHFEIVGDIKEMPKVKKKAPIDTAFFEPSLFIISKTTYSQRIHLKDQSNFSQIFEVKFQPINNVMSLPYEAIEFVLTYNKATQVLKIDLLK